MVCIFALIICTEHNLIYFENEKRVQGIKIVTSNDRVFHIFNVYLPCDDNTAESFALYNHVLSVISVYCIDNSINVYIVGGDLNTELCRHTSRNTISLKNYVHQECLFLCCKLNLSDVEYTFCSPAGVKSLLDHFIVSTNISDFITKYTCIDCHADISDHMPLLIEISGHAPLASHDGNRPVSTHAKPLWSTITIDNIAKYKQCLDVRLSNYILPDALYCCDFNCNNAKHVSDIMYFYMFLVETLIFSTNDVVPMSNMSPNENSNVPGWNIEISIAKEKSLLWHDIWKGAGEPEFGILTDIMKSTRKHYHYLIRQIKRDRNLATKQALGNSLSNNQSRKYWSEVKKINIGKSSAVHAVNGLSDNKCIANSFAVQYAHLYSSVTSDSATMYNICNCIDTRINNVCLSNSCTCGLFTTHAIKYDNVNNAIRSLRTGKNDGVDQICSDNFKHASDLFVEYIVYLYNSMLYHNCVPPSFLRATVIPIPKSQRLDLSNSGNYRAIALSSIFSKILDKVIIQCQFEQFVTSNLQFGYKCHSSTNMCTTMLTETIEYYVNNNSSVFVLLIDASKAFDRICHSKMFDLLLSRNVCPLILRFLFSLYTNSEMQVGWKSENSDMFPLKNGVKQGGCLSPILFTVYLDGLLCKLKHSGIGCHIGRNYCGAFGYADDLALVSPTIYGLKKMISICEDYAIDFNILFNPKKSKMLCYNMLSPVKPIVKLCNQVVDVVEHEVYLGNHISTDIYKSGIDDIVFNFERTSNHIVHSFSMCDSITLKSLFSSHCESFYGCELLNFSDAYMSKLYVSWRKIIRRIFRLPYRAHNYLVSYLGDCIITRLDRRLCKYVYKLINSENMIVQSVVKCKLISSTSILAENYRYLCYKYSIAHSDWTKNMTYIINKISKQYTNAELAIGKTVLELCKLRDGIDHCEFITNIEVCKMIDMLCTE